MLEFLESDTLQKTHFFHHMVHKQAHFSDIGSSILKTNPAWETKWTEIRYLYFRPDEFLNPGLNVKSSFNLYK